MRDQVRALDSKLVVQAGALTSANTPDDVDAEVFDALDAEGRPQAALHGAGAPRFEDGTVTGCFPMRVGVSF